MPSFKVFKDRISLAWAMLKLQIETLCDLAQ